MTDEQRRAAAREMGNATGGKKAKAARINGRLGGHPGGKNLNKRRPNKNSTPKGIHYEPAED